MSSLTHQHINKQKGTTMFTVRLATKAELSANVYPDENWVIVDENDRLVEDAVYPSQRTAIYWLREEGLA